MQVRKIRNKDLVMIKIGDFVYIPSLEIKGTVKAVNASNVDVIFLDGEGKSFTKRVTLDEVQIVDEVQFNLLPENTYIVTAKDILDRLRRAGPGSSKAVPAAVDAIANTQNEHNR